MDCLPRRRRTRSDVLGWRAPDGKIGGLIVLSCGELAPELLRSRRLLDRPRSPVAAARPIMVPTPGERSPGGAHPALSAPAAGPGGAAKRAAVAAAVRSAGRPAGAGGQGLGVRAG